MLKSKNSPNNTISIDVWSDILETGKVKAVNLELSSNSTISDLIRSFRERFDVSLERRIIISQVGLMNGEQQKLDAVTEVKTVLKSTSAKKHVLVAKIKDKTTVGSQSTNMINPRFERGKGFRKCEKKGGSNVLREKTVSDNSYNYRNSQTTSFCNQFGSLGRNGNMNMIPKFMTSTTTICSESAVLKKESTDDSDSSSRTSDVLIKSYQKACVPFVFRRIL